ERPGRGQDVHAGREPVLAQASGDAFRFLARGHRDQDHEGVLAFRNRVGVDFSGHHFLPHLTPLPYFHEKSTLTPFSPRLTAGRTPAYYSCSTGGLAPWASPSRSRS